VDNLNIWIVAILGLVIIVVILYFISRPKYLKYKEDTFYNLKWRWEYRGAKVVSLWAYCPDCDSSLICDDESCKNHDNLKDKLTFFICQNCGSEKGRIVGGDRRYVLKIIEREITKRISKGDFEKKIDGV
jgi:predicted RNA-binding Zn-ribbon protein involved in translation (DUF1610 family)